MVLYIFTSAITSSFTYTSLYSSASNILLCYSLTSMPCHFTVCFDSLSKVIKLYYLNMTQEALVSIVKEKRMQGTGLQGSMRDIQDAMNEYKGKA